MPNVDDKQVGHVSDNVIQFQSVRKQFGEFVAVEHADFSIARGEFFSLLGPSGCGKTTLLKMIAGFEQPTSGAILLDGADVSMVPPYKRNVNTVFQQYALFPHMSVLDNVAFGLRSKGAGTAEARREAAEMLEIVRLGDFRNRRPTQLSGGQQQRVALARALVNKPSALLLDEPLAALDLKLREAMQLELKRIQRELGITFVFVTHDQGEALTMSDRIAVMSKGRVEQIGTPEEIYDRPAGIFVAGFIGSANLLPGRVNASGSSVDLEMGATIDVADTSGHEPGTEVTVMIRPERLEPYNGEMKPNSSFVGEIKDVIYQGSEIGLIVHLDSTTEIVATIEPDDMNASVVPGGLITLAWVPDAPFVMPGRSAIVGATTTDVDEVQATMAGTDLGSGKNDGDDSSLGSNLGRRALLVGGGLAAAAVVVGGVLAFTGNGGGSNVDGDDDEGALGSGGSSTLGSGSNQVRILNWQAYVDPSEDGAIGTVDRFIEATGVATRYSEDFNDNNEVYNRLIAPVVGAGQKMDYDIICPTNWLAARLRTLGWIEPLPLDLIPNRVNLEDRFLNQKWDFGALYNLPWQAGITGIAYNPSLTGREFTTVADLWDEAIRGRVALLTEMRDSVGLVMMSLGYDPSTLDEEAAMEAIGVIEEQTRSGQIRAFTGNEYLDGLRRGDIAACIAWSGDIVQLQYETDEIEFYIPEEGGMSWYDTMVIPKGADNGVAAAEWMNFVYDPVQAAQLTYWVQYISPVKGVKEELIKMGGDAADLAESQILFPDEATAARLKVFANLPEDVEARINDRFLGVTGA
ncbi:MAG TPA: polyamine ABC transporter ATP-binding protein [Ilumatobacter sp.]|nr:polyamine ABC transporter ATP-binding protein [Ilumatobacter sp.]